MTEAEKVSELHQDVKNGLLNNDFEKVKNWQKDSYHKQMMGGFKETKEAEEGFKKAQKPWAKKLKEVRGNHLNYCTLEHCRRDLDQIRTCTTLCCNLEVVCIEMIPPKV